MKTLTWTRDSHGLFDYESPDTKKADFQVRSVGVLARNATGDVSLVDETVGQQAQATKLLRVEAATAGSLSYNR